MWISTRNYFKRGDPGWENYIEFIQIPGLVEVRSIDSMLNDFVEDSGAVPCEREDVFEMIRELPPVSSGAYYQLAVNLREESARAASPGWNLLGYDLSDETRTSSILNCGPWKGRLAPFVGRLNGFGLLTLEDATLVQRILPEVWGEEEPHARCDIWQLHEVVAR